MQWIYHKIIDLCRKFVFSRAKARAEKNEKKMKRLIQRMNIEYQLLDGYLKAGGYNHGQRKEYRKQITKGINLFKE
jgi:hypothetical protein